MSDIGGVDDGEFVSDGEESVISSVESVEPNQSMRLIYEPPPADNRYGEPFLDCVPAKVVEIICSWVGLKEIAALRQTCKALNRAVAIRPGIWTSLVAEYRRLHPESMLLGDNAVVMPQVHHLTGFQEDILRCGFILRNKWHKPAFQARQIFFVPGTMGRYFLTVSSVSVVLWTLEPDGVPQSCRTIIVAPTNEIVVHVLASRPPGSLIAYLAVQITQQHTHRLRTEIYQLHLSRPGILSELGFGLSAVHETEGALVAFVDYVLAYALNDAGQTILLCCWVTKRATKLATPVSEREIRWQHSSCRAVAIGKDVIVVVRDSTAEIYPRNEFAVIDYDYGPSFNRPVLRGKIEMLPVTYATDTATFPSSFLASPSIFIHNRQSASNGNDDQTQAVRVISVVGVARSAAPLTDPSIPYFVVAAQLYRWTPSRHHGSSQSTSPSPTAPPSPSHTTPSPAHTRAQSPSRHTPSPNSSQPVSSPGLPPVEKYKFVFHVHALQHQHPHFSYGQAVAGPNGRSVILATAVNMNNGPNQPKQYVLKYRHPSYRELKRFIRGQFQPGAPFGGLESNPVSQRPGGAPQPVGAPQAFLQQAHVQLPPPPAHPLLNQHHAPSQEPHYGVLSPLTRPHPMLDVLRGMSSLWHTQDMLGYEMIAWDEGAGTLLVASRLAEVVVLECAKPASDPVGASSWHRN